MTREHRNTALVGAAGLSALLLAAGCAGQDARGAEEAPEETPHGHVEGARESAEPRSRLVVADARSGEVRVLDLVTEEVTGLDPVEGVDGIAGDGRFAYLSSSDHRTTHIVDSGAWTVDHGDHSHYYRAEIRAVGPLEGLVAGQASTDTALTALTGRDGGAAVLDRAALEEGEVGTAAPVPDGAAAVLPIAGRLLVAEGGAEGGVRVHDRSGSPLELLDDTCAQPRGQALTRRGAVIGCADGTLHVTEDDGELTSTLVPHPDGAEGRTGEFHHRPGSATLASVSTGGEVWVLDLAEPGWTRLDLPGAVAVTAVGAGGPVLALTGDGTLHSLDPRTGEEYASADLLSGTDPEHAPVIRADTSRAYVNDAEGGVVHEIDYDDDLRVARTLDTGTTPHFMVETGR
ncbi:MULTISPECIES: WD40 repeat domain-containing protein [Nocardiopsis]|uniref:ABC transporter n=1 Tax=Nocardiopsis sinuspersici TaxID=501010 RepID=A0A1V3C235_9ACTN|nr:MULTISPECIES: ABC transporter [Nocardiopsis]OOC54864.1 ABC transporter [Nocardiopsis sinuspersici]